MRAAAVLLAAGLLSAASGGASAQDSGRELRGIDAARFLFDNRDYDACRRFCYAVCWMKLEPEGLYLLGQSLEKLGRKDEAAVYYTILARLLDERDEAKKHPAAAAYRRFAEARLVLLGRKHREEAERHARSAEGRRWSSPAEADDLWMSGARADLRSIHDLYLWKIVGGRKDVRADWIHNTQGRMHRSGAKYMDDVHGRRGVLFCVPSKRPARPSRLFVTNHAGAAKLRIGVRAYGFSFVLRVTAGGRELASITVGKDAWRDLAVDLGAAARAGAEIVLEFVVPEDQQRSEGLFLDYVDFYGD